MSIYKETTSKGNFLVEAGSFKKKCSKFEEHYWSERTDRERWQASWDLFINFHLSHGLKADQLRLDRTVVEFGRKQSKIHDRRRVRSR